MIDDKALRIALSQSEAQLPDGFHARVMEKIHREAALRDKRNYLAGIVLAGVLSFILVSGAVFLLAIYSDFSFSRLFRPIDLQFLAGLSEAMRAMTSSRLGFHLLAAPSLVYYACFTSVVLVLLLLDLLIRQRMGRIR